MSNHTAVRALMLVSTLTISACSQAFVWSLPPDIVATLAEQVQHQGHGGQTATKAKEKPKEKTSPAQQQHADPKKPAQHDQHKDPEKPMQHEMGGMQMGSMKGTQGDWSMNRQGSGTSWLPDASPMFMKTLPSWNGFEVHLMGNATLNYADAGGRRGENQVFSNSMAMAEFLDSSSWLHWTHFSTERRGIRTSFKLAKPLTVSHLKTVNTRTT